jgi:hypothetical protein
MNEVDRVVDEIKQIRAQYANEVGEGRRAWPRSIRSRVDELEDHGLKPKLIAEMTGVPYETVCYWRYTRKSTDKKSFHAIAVVTPKEKDVARPEKNLTVTVKSTAKSSIPSNSVPLAVTVTTPDGLKMEMRLEMTFGELLQLLRGP